MEKAVAALVGSIPQLTPYTAIKGKAPAERRHHIQTIKRELLVDRGRLSFKVVGDCTSDLPGATTMRTLV